MHRPSSVMKCILHLSDLHFKRIDRRKAAALLAWTRHAKVDYVVVSGDLTQRARPEEFDQARRFLDSIPAPRLVIPGNHDIPLYDLFTRLTDPYRRYRERFNTETEPLIEDESLAILGVSTSRPHTIQSGAIPETKKREIMARLAHVSNNRLRIWVTHHPIRSSTPRLASAKWIHLDATEVDSLPVDLILSGHLHVGGVELLGSRGVLSVLAGTSISTRERGEVNSFNRIIWNGVELSIERFLWEEGTTSFKPGGTRRFVRTPHSTGVGFLSI